jgi:hypothetical protein
VLLGEYTDVSNTLVFNVSSVFPQPITRFRLEPFPDNGFGIGPAVQFSPVPEPSSPWYIAGALVALSARYRNRISRALCIRSAANTPMSGIAFQAGRGSTLVA